MQDSSLQAQRTKLSTKKAVMNMCGTYQYKGWARRWVWKLGINWPPFSPLLSWASLHMSHQNHDKFCSKERFHNDPGKYVDCSDFLGVLVGGEYSQKMDHKKGFWKSCYYVTNPLFFGFCIKETKFWRNFCHILTQILTISFYKGHDN